MTIHNGVWQWDLKSAVISDNGYTYHFSLIWSHLDATTVSSVQYEATSQSCPYEALFNNMSSWANWGSSRVYSHSHRLGPLGPPWKWSTTPRRVLLHGSGTAGWVLHADRLLLIKCEVSGRQYTPFFLKPQTNSLKMNECEVIRSQLALIWMLHTSLILGFLH